MLEQWFYNLFTIRYSKTGDSYICLVFCVNLLYFSSWDGYLKVQNGFMLIECGFHLENHLNSFLISMNQLLLRKKSINSISRQKLRLLQDLRKR